MSLDWLRQRERGSWVSIQGMLWAARYLGRPVARVLLYPVCFYYILFTAPARRTVRRFLEKVLSRRVGWRALFHHYYHFASTILDRVYFLRGEHGRFQVNVHGLEALTQCLKAQKGCVLLGSHLGSFEIVRTTARWQPDVEVRVLMHEENSPLIRELVRQLNPQVANSVIAIGAPDTMIRVKECLDRGGVVGILGDRLVKQEQGTLCKFFGQLVRFPTAAARLMSLVGSPVVLFFGLYRGGNRYDVHFELFADQVTLDRELRDQQIQQWTQRYVDRLEHYCRLAPDNWFNFYDIWQDNE